MKILQWTEVKENRGVLLEIKAIDSGFHFNVRKEKLFYIDSGGSVYGYAVLEVGEEAEIKRIFVNPKLRNNGYGSLLLKYMINWLINNNFDTLKVVDHRKMNNFLEKQKFIKTEEGYYQLGNLSVDRKRRRRFLSVSGFAVVINIFLALLKLISGNMFRSSSLLSDGLNSLSDLITNIIVIIGLKVGENPEDKEHPFGHGKIEPVFSVIIGTFIILTAFELIKENISGLFHGKKGTGTSLIPIVVTIVAVVIKFIQFLFIRNMTKGYNGVLVNSLLQDYKADIVVSISVLCGILLSRINPIADIAVGTLVAAYIIYSGYNLIKENAMILIDSQDDVLLEGIKRDVSSFEEIMNAHDFRMTVSGKDVYIFADVRMEKSMTIDEAHEVTNKISKFIKHKYRNIKRVLIHVEPMYDSDSLL